MIMWHSMWKSKCDHYLAMTLCGDCSHISVWSHLTPGHQSVIINVNVKNSYWKSSDFIKPKIRSGLVTLIYFLMVIIWSGILWEKLGHLFKSTNGSLLLGIWYFWFWQIKFLLTMEARKNVPHIMKLSMLLFMTLFTKRSVVKGVMKSARLFISILTR